MADYQDNSGKGLGEAVFFVTLAVGLVFGCWFALRIPILFAGLYSSFYMFRLYEYLPFLMTANEYAHLVAARAAIPSMRPSEYGVSALMSLFEYHGYVWRWVAIPGLIYWGWRIRKSVVRFKFNRNIKDIYQLIDIQAKHFPASAIIQGKNLLSKHPYIGPWRTYALPLDFALDHQLLWTSKTLKKDEPIDESTAIPIPPFTPNQKTLPFPEKRKMLPHYRYVGLHVERAEAVFTKQLGGLWQGSKGLPPLERALFAALCAHIAGEIDDCWKMINQLAFSFNEGTWDEAKGKLVSPHYADTKGTDELLEKYENHFAVKRIVKNHAHTVNVYSNVLDAARKKGRITHANFLWLRPVNHLLWYALQGRGGQCPYWEAAGAWAHEQVEKRIGKKIVNPMTAGAVLAFKDLMSKEHWIDPGEYSEEAQRRLVAEANALLEAEQERLANEKQGANVNGMFGGGMRQPRPKVQKPKREDDEP